MVPYLLILLARSFLVEMNINMNIRIEKMKDIDQGKVLDFLVGEGILLFLNLHPEYQELYIKKYHQKTRDMFFQYFKENLQKKPIVYVAFCDEKIIGCGFVDKNGYLNSLFVQETYQKQGIGTRLVKKLIESCSQYKVLTLTTRKECIPFYEKFSFTLVEKSGYQDFVKMKLERKKYGK